MRKFLLTTIACLMTVCMMAVGKNDGSSKANAIDFSWSVGHDHEAGDKLWYRVDLDSISGLVDPTLALYMTNMSDQASKVTVDVSATIAVSTPFFSYSVDTAVVNDESYTIAKRDYKLLSQNVKMLIEMNVRYLYLELHSEQNIKLSAKKYETSDIIDDACTKAGEFQWSGVDVPVGETWYRLNLTEVKSLGQELDFVVTNTATVAQAKVKFELSLDCPASTIFPYDWTIPAGEAMTEEFGRIFIDELNDDYVYLKLTTDQALELKVTEKPAPPVLDEIWTVDEKLVEGQSYTISGETVFEIDMATLSAPRGARAEFVVTNNGANDTLSQWLSFANPVKNIIEKHLPVAANSSVTKEVVNNMAGQINSNKVYVRFATKGEMTIQLNYVVVNQEVVDAKPVVLPTCENSEQLSWNSSVKQKGLETKWYEIDLASIKQNDEHLQLSFTNKSKNLVVVMGEILPTCNSKDTIPYILPVEPGKTLSQVINYNLFALLPHPEHFYVSAMVIPTTATSTMELKDIRSKDDILKMVPKDLEAIQAAEVELVAKTYSALVDPNACNQATTIASGVKYEQVAGTTKWYRVTDELLNKLSLIPDVAFINNGKQAANVTLAASVDCEHSTFGMSTFSLPTWADLTVFPIRLLGDLLDKALNEDVKEMYLQVTTDQPIAFGIDIDYGFGLGCDDAREFDWTKGAVIEKGDAQWLSFDITSVKKNKQQVRLTLTNESNSLAWVAMLTSLTCPFDVALPMVFAIPAGTSIDKVVDYSYFAATKLDQLYVALITEEKISVKAVAEKSQASASDYAACANAVEVKNGEAYVQKAGTTWYKFDRSLFSDVSRLPKFRYAAEATTSLTMGVTVGCEYNIATRGTIKLPTTKGLEVSFRMPGFIYDVLDKFVHDDVEAVYVEMTTDQQIKFGIDMEYAGGCEKAAKLDLSKPLDIDLTANKDSWYYIDLKDVRAMGDEKISFRLNNQSDKAVEVEFEVTPTCPLVVSAIKSVDVPAGVDLPLMFPASAITNLYDQVVAKFDIPDKIANNLPSQLQDDLIYYVRVRANGDLSIEEGDSIPDHVEPGCEEATPLDITKAIDVDKLQKGWYVVDLTTIKNDFSLKFVNNTGSNQTLDFQFYKGCDLDEAKMLENYLTSYNFVIPTTGLEQTVPYSLISSYLTIDELYIYVNKTEGGEVDMACASALLIDLHNPFMIELEEGKEQWFKIAPKDYANFDKNLVISTKNLSGKSVKVDFSLATSCPALVTIDSTITVNSDLNRVDSITAGMIDLAWDKYGDKVDGIDTAYIRVLANGNLQLVVDTFTVVIPEMPEGCENAAELDFSKTIKLSELPTGWYHVDLTPLKNGQVKSVSINNDLGQETGVKFDIFRSCEENSFLYTYTHAFKVGLFEQSIPSAALSMLGSIDELYIYITVGVDVLTCEDAIEFDWSKGAVHKAGSTEWYHFDINPIKANNQQVKLTFTNHSSELAVMYGEVALHCPYTYSIPYACVVPAGMSVDKVIDYSIFAASRVEELYVKVYSSETIELGATTESAEVFDNTPCNNATTVQSGVEYTQQAGTSWYRLPKSLFKQTGKLPKFYFTTEEEGLTKITLGATVGCDHNIATKTIFMLPGSLNYAMVVHEKIFDAWDMLVNDEVTEVYVEVTTDKAVSFSVDMINDTDDPCHAAELLDVTKGINLEANKEKWYKIDLDALKAMKSDVAVKLINPSASAVTLDMEFSPTCPVVVSLNKSLAIPAIAEVTKVISQSTIAKIPGVSFYVRFESTADLQITFSEPELPEDPASCEDAILLDWTKTINLSELKTGWYKFDLTELHAQKKDFTLSLNNDLGRATVLGLELYETCESARLVNMTDSISEGLHVKSLAYDMVTMMIGDAAELYAYITIDATPVPPTPADGCETADTLNIGVPEVILADTDVWYVIDLSTLPKQDLSVKLKNIDNVEAVINWAYTFDCPGYMTELPQLNVAAGDSIEQTIPYAVFQDYADGYLYLNIRTTANIEITLGEAQGGDEPKPEGCEDAKQLDWTKTINLSELPTGWYWIDLTPIHEDKKDLTLSLNNDLGETTNVGFDFYTSCEGTSIYDIVYSFPVGMNTTTVPYSMLQILPTSIKKLYVYIEVGAKLPCEDAILFDWNKGAYQDANKTQWYEFDIAPVLEQEKQVKLTFTNHSNENAWVIAELAFHCPYTKSIPIIVPVPANMSVDKWIDYSAFEASRIEHFYMGVTTREAAIELAATWEDARITPSDGCLNATKVETDVLYEHAAGTHWYKFTGDLFDKEGYFSRVRVVNRSAETVNITAGGTVGCEYNIATRTSFKLPMRFDLAFAIPVWVIEQMKKLVDDDVTEFYLELTTDQPIAFSIGQDACESAIPFDWTTGHTQEALTTQWYDVNIAPVLANEQQIKLTLTNHSDQTAWVATLVSLDCPFKVALPLAFPIPAGMSVDKVIDYSYFAATRLDQLYVGVTTDSKISITAEAQSAEASTMDKDGCAKAILLENGVRYTHPAGTSWYKVDASFFADMTRLPKFRFATVSGETTKVTMGATVGCDYNIATRGTVSLPGGVDLALRVPRFILKAMKLFVRDDVNEFYIQLTTDKDAEFSIYSATKEEVLACQEASELVISDNMSISLKADQDVWYKVDLTDLYSIKKDLAVTVATSSTEKVDVEVEVSPTCPMVASAMKELALPAGVNLTKVITQAQIAEILKKYPDLIYYVRVRATEDLDVEVEEYIPVEGCEEAIEYQWGNNIQLNAGDDKWYKLSLVDLRGKDCNITLTVNNASADTVKSTLDLYEDCPATADNQILTIKDLAIAPDTILTKTVSSNELPLDIDTIYLHVEANGQVTVNLTADCVIPPVVEYVYQTITSYDCVDAVQTWNDTVQLSDTLISINTYVVNPFVSPVVMTDSILATILGGTMPEFTQGVTPVVEKAEIYTYYDAIDTDSIADVVLVDWKTGKVDCEALFHAMTLVVVDACGDTILTTHNFPVVQRPAGKIDTAIICAEEVPYMWQSKSFATTGVYYDTIQSVNGCDSILTLNLTVLPAVDEIITKETICYGESYTWNGNDYNQTGKDTIVVTNQLGCDSVYNILDLTVLPQPVEVVTDTTICDGDYFLWNNQICGKTGTYADTVLNLHNCVDTIYTMNVTVLPAKRDSIHKHAICYGDTLLWFGTEYTVTTNDTYTETNQLGCDSIVHHLKLTVANENDSTVIYGGFCYGTSYEITLGGQDYTFTTAGQHIVSVNGCEVTLYLVEYPEVPITHEYDTICEGETYTWHHNSYTQAGDYECNKHQNIHGCDSILVLHLTVNTKDTTEFSATACGSYEWNGITYTTSNDYVQTFTNIHGCDSIVTLHLTINQPNTSEETVTTCGSYEWNGTVYTQSGDYSYTTTGSNGCDSIVTLHLTILETEYKSYPVSICSDSTYIWDIDGKPYTQADANKTIEYTEYYTGTTCPSIVHTLQLNILADGEQRDTTVYICAGESYSWEGAEYRTAGTYINTLPSCNATSTLHLFVNQPTTGDTTAVACEEFTWYGKTYTASGDYTDTLINVNGCDSVVTLHLTINQPKTSDTVAVACGSFEWYGTTYTTSGNYDQTFTAANGCDSIVTLHLTFEPINIKKESPIVQEICYGGTYEWNGIICSEDKKTYVYRERVGCDSIIHQLYLIVHPIQTTEVTVDGVCYGGEYHWDVTNKIYNTSGTYTDTLQDIHGCDSIVTLHLIVHDSIAPTETSDTICYGDSIEWQGKFYKGTGKYYETLKCPLGCDSIVILDLTVLPEIPVTIQNETMSYGGSYTWIEVNNEIYTAPDTYRDTLLTVNGCDSIFELHLTMLPPVVVTKDTTITAFVCDGTGYEDPITKKMHIISSLIPSTQTWKDTVHVHPELDSIYVFEITPIVAPEKMTDATLATIYGGMPILTRGVVPSLDVDMIKNYYDGVDNDSISDVDTLYWIAASVACDAQTHTMTLVVRDECGNEIETTHIFDVAQPEIILCDTTICYGTDFTWNVTGKVYSETKIYEDTLRSAYGCDSAYVRLNLTVRPENRTEIDTTLCYGVPFIWRAMQIAIPSVTKDTVIVKNFAAADINECDSIVVLNLTVLPEAKEVTTTKTICAGETFTWSEGDGQPYAVTTIGKVYTVQYAGTTCDSLVAILNLTVLPEAKVETEEWTLCPGDLSTPRNWHGQSISAAGNYEAIEKFAGTDCDSVIYQLTVIIPDADNNATMDNLPAVSKYNNRIIMLNLNEIKDMFDGWAPAEADVQWFRVVGTQDAAYAAWNKLGDDEPLAKGHYYNLPDGGTLPAGQYYALLMRPTEECEGGEIMRTVLITCGVDASGPRLVPNVVRANEMLTLENLNPSDVNEIRVYSSTGQLVATYTAEQVSKFIFNAATVSGYYLVDVENKNNKVTLRYVVK